MSRKTISFAAFAEERRTDHGGEIDLGPDHDPILVPDVALWPSDTAARPDVEWQMRRIIGDAEYERFIDVTGSTAIMLNEIVKSIAGGTVGESKASSTSSGRTRKK